MNILNIERKKLNDEKSKRSLSSALDYSDRLQCSIDTLLHFDEKNVDDILDVKEAYIKTGVFCVLSTLNDEYQFLVNESGELLATSIKNKAIKG